MNSELQTKILNAKEFVIEAARALADAYDHHALNIFEFVACVDSAVQELKRLEGLLKNQ
jgi:hypothetical protein